MKYIMVTLAIFFSVSDSISQDPYAKDVQSLDAIIEALYGVISGDKGVKRDWDRFAYLFSPEAKLIPTVKNDVGKSVVRVLSPQDYVERSGAYLEKNGFFEKEIQRKTETYGSLVHIWSTYESYRTSEDKVPFMRGINSIQLLNDGERWWIVNIYWLGESDDNPLPEKYLR